MCFLHEPVDHVSYLHILAHDMCHHSRHIDAHWSLLLRKSVFSQMDPKVKGSWERYQLFRNERLEKKFSIRQHPKEKELIDELEKERQVQYRNWLDICDAREEVEERRQEAERRAQQEAEEEQKEKDKHAFNEALMKSAYDLMLKKKAEREKEPADKVNKELEEEDKGGEEPAGKMNKELEEEDQVGDEEEVVSLGEPGDDEVLALLDWRARVRAWGDFLGERDARGETSPPIPPPPPPPHR